MLPLMTYCGGSRSQSRRVDLCEQYILGLLNQRELPSTEFEGRLRAAGYSARTIDRARRAAEVRPTQRDGSWYVSLANIVEEVAQAHALSVPGHQSTEDGATK